MKLADCRVGVLVCIKPDAQKAEDNDAIGHVIGLRKVCTGGIVSQRHAEPMGLSIEVHGAACWTGPSAIVPLIQFADRVYPVVIHHDDLDLFTEY